MPRRGTQAHEKAMPLRLAIVGIGIVIPYPLRKAFDKGKLRLRGKLAPLRDPQAFAYFLRTARTTDWVAYSKPPFGGPAQVLDYLGRYTHRVAISNDRLVELNDAKVTFRWKDYRQGNRIQLMTLDANEFIRRFLLHGLPPGFVHLRYYGLLSNRDRAQKLAQCRELIGQTKPGDSEPQLPADCKSRYRALTGESLETCPLCRVGRMVCIETIPASVRWPTRRRVKPVVDSS